MWVMLSPRWHSGMLLSDVFIFVSEGENLHSFFRYQHGFGLKKDDETAVFYAYRASNIASESYHQVGGQPLAQTDRITDRTESEVRQVYQLLDSQSPNNDSLSQVHKGNEGNDDEIIQTLIMQAKEVCL